ncbi:MAG: single-stranded-DNA-specific exonuclease RecJ [Puniceicoccales bacterium]|jgi:single-stranded-DNA-specific exonuclease|nr:single-stranded-DNA-specific exonuclease RecJ [Puniceicoccales bacterium]
MKGKVVATAEFCSYSIVVMCGQLRWRDLRVNEDETEKLRQFLRVPRISAKLLAARGHSDPRTARFFLEPHLRNLEDPFNVLLLRETAERLVEALERKETVAVIGDYDVDGITSTALMAGVLRYFGAAVRYYIPRRFDEGYGLSQNVLARAFADGRPDLLIALDCATNSLEQLQWIRDRGTTPIVIDHHRATRPIDGNLLLVNPNGHGGADGARHGIFCTGGLVFKCIYGLLKLLRKKKNDLAFSYDLQAQLDLVALATVADVVPLTGENRIFVKHGLRELENPRRVGMRAIIAQGQMESGSPLSAADLSYRICPRINASGRIADATLPVEMFLTESRERAEAIAAQLTEMNAERQRIESEITEEASRMVEADYADRNSIVLFNDRWHTGVIGIVAGKLMQRYRKPCVVLSKEEGQMAKGSGRCVCGLNLVDLLSKCSQHLGSWGGHPLAAGIGMPISNVDRFREAFEVHVSEALKIIDVANDLEIAEWLNPEDISQSLVRQLRRLEPFGYGNPQPTFGVQNVRFLIPPRIFGSRSQHFNFTFRGRDGPVWGVAWGLAKDLPLPQPCDIAVRLSVSCRDGCRRVRVEMVDFRPHRPPENRKGGERPMEVSVCSL